MGFSAIIINAEEKLTGGWQSTVPAAGLGWMNWVEIPSEAEGRETMLGR